MYEYLNKEIELGHIKKSVRDQILYHCVHRSGEKTNMKKFFGEFLNFFRIDPQGMTEDEWKRFNIRAIEGLFCLCVKNLFHVEQQ